MRIVTATEASRRFSALLDEAERGETFVVTRGGRRVATLSPSPSANGGAVADFFRSWAGRIDADAAEEFEANLREARAVMDSGVDADPWAE